MAAIRARFLERPTHAKGISLLARLQGWLVEARRSLSCDVPWSALKPVAVPGWPPGCEGHRGRRRSRTKAMRRSVAARALGPAKPMIPAIAMKSGMRSSEAKSGCRSPLPIAQWPIDGRNLSRCSRAARLVTSIDAGCRRPSLTIRSSTSIERRSLPG